MQQKIYTYFSNFYIISIIGIIFGCWFATNQVEAVANGSLFSYPKVFFLQTIIKCTLTIVATFYLVNVVLSKLILNKLNSSKISLTFLPLLLVYLKCSMGSILLLIFLLQVIYLFSLVSQADYRYWRTNYLANAIVFIVYFGAHYVLTTRFSPRFWQSAILTLAGGASDEILTATPLFMSYQNVKHFSFSNFDHSQWAGILNPPITLGSTFLQFLTFSLDLPSADPLAFHAVYNVVNFVLIVLGSFGLYLFLRYAAKVRIGVAFCGGLLFFFSGKPMINEMLSWDGGILMSPYAIICYAMLFIAIAFEKKEITFSYWAGAALASQFFFFSPHSEGVIYTVLMYALFTLGLLFFSKHILWKDKLKFSVASFIVFGLLTSVITVPLMVDLAQHNMSVYGHISDISVNHRSEFVELTRLLSIFLLLSFVLLLGQKKLTPAYLSILLLTLTLYLLLWGSTYLDFNKFVILTLHIPIHIWVSWRLGIFLFLLVFILASYVADAIANIIFSKCLIFFSELFVKALGIFLSGFLVVCSFFIVFPSQIITDGIREDNPEACAYYISLQSLLANYRMLAKDKANLTLIKNRLLKFENDLKRKKSPLNILSQYKVKFKAALAGVNINSVTKMADAHTIIAFAQKNSRLIDAFYLDPHFYCVTPLYDWTKVKRKVMRYNLTSLYENIPNKYSRIVAASIDDTLTSPLAYFFNNQTATMDVRFATGMPLLTSLYVMPKYDFSTIGHYSEAMPWHMYNAALFNDPIIRKVLNVGGIDIFTVRTWDLRQPILDTKPINAYLNPIFGTDFQSFFNTQSYGMAYIANNISYENPATIIPYENVIKKHLSNHKQIEQFKNATYELYQKLLNLKNKGDIILESTSFINDSHTSTKKMNGTVEIKGVIGERALFEANCFNKNCVFVYNTAKALGWHAYVNDKPSIIQRVNFAFMGVFIPQGKTLIWFIYQPFYQFLLYLISLGTLIWITNRTCLAKSQG